jgi:hypothetical protein
MQGQFRWSILATLRTCPDCLLQHLGSAKACLLRLAACMYLDQTNLQRSTIKPVEKAPAPFRRPIKPMPGSRRRSAMSPFMMARADGSTMAWSSFRVERSVSVGGPETPIPADIAVFDGTGKWVTPGIIDIHSHLGDYPTPSVAAHDRTAMKRHRPTTPKSGRNTASGHRIRDFQPCTGKWRDYDAADPARLCQPFWAAARLSSRMSMRARYRE